MTDDRKLLDDDGENRAVRTFLMRYSCDRATTVGAMRDHMRRSGWRLHWPAWVDSEPAGAHLTKAGAQLWIRHLLQLEAGTPAASWRAAGEVDPHAGQYDIERAALTLGRFTDDELANGIFMNYDVRPHPEKLIAGTHFSPIVWMTAGKERIRWLSRALVKATAEAAQARAAAETWAAAAVRPKVKDHVLRGVVNNLRDTAKRFSSSGQLRDRLRGCLGPLIGGIESDADRAYLALRCAQLHGYLEACARAGEPVHGHLQTLADLRASAIPSPGPLP